MNAIRHDRIVSSAIAALCLGLAALPAATAAAPAIGTSSSGIPYVSDEQAGPPDLVAAIRSRRAGGKLLNLDRMLLHSPEYAKAWNTMFATVRSGLSVPPRLRELAIMAIGALNGSDYEWAQHEREFLKTGGTRAQLAALKGGATERDDPKLFDEAERATLALTTEMTRDIKVKPATMKRIRALLPDRQVVELVGTIGAYNLVSRFVVATGVEVER